MSDVMYERRRVMALMAAAGTTAWSPWASAQSRQAVKILVGFAAGGSADQTARLLADQLRDKLDGRSVIVDNRTGAGGRLAVEAAKTAKPDGDTLVFVPHGPMTLFQHIYRTLRYDPVHDFAPIGRVCTFDFAVATGPATPAKTLAEYLAWARQPDHRAAYGSPGAGTVPHFIGQALAERTKVPMTHVPYRGAAPSLIDLIGGAVPLVIAPVADMLEHHKTGKIRVLATTGSASSAALPGVPTLRQAGVDLVVDGWYGLYAPAAVPAETQAKLASALQVAVPALAAPLARSALVAAPADPQALAQIQKTESEFWAQLVKTSGFKPED